MRRAVVLTLALLAGCGAVQEGGYRDAGLSLYSNASFSSAGLTGDWVQVAGFQRGLGKCSAGTAQFSAPDATGRLQLEADLCLSGRETPFRGLVEPAGPGRFALSGADPQGIGQVWWVIWADVDNRTLVIGTPSGAFGFILNRDGHLPADRLAAAREILDWNGYDLSQLKVF